MSDIYDRSVLPGWTVEQRAKAVWAVASRAVSAEDCARLLAQLGLDPSEAVGSAASAMGTGTTAATRRPREVM